MKKKQLIMNKKLLEDEYDGYGRVS
jgi:hypothetical protein